MSKSHAVYHRSKSNVIEYNQDMRVMINFSPGYCAADLFLFSPFKLVEVNKKCTQAAHTYSGRV